MVISGSVNGVSKRVSPVIDYGGVRVRAQYRHVATVVVVQGRIDAGNADRVGEEIRRFVLAGEPLVVDLTGVDPVDPTAIRMIGSVDTACRAAGMEWALVAGPAFLSQLDPETVLLTSTSVPEALHMFADTIARQRQLLLPLIKKTA